MGNWITLGSAADFAEGCQTCVTAEASEKRVPLIVMRIDGALHVVSNVCPHAGLPLGDGERRGKVLTCPFHGYAYNVENGRNIDFPEEEPPVPVYAHRVSEAGELEVEVGGEAT